MWEWSLHSSNRKCWGMQSFWTVHSTQSAGKRKNFTDFPWFSPNFTDYFLVLYLFVVFWTVIFVISPISLIIKKWKYFNQRNQVNHKNHCSDICFQRTTANIIIIFVLKFKWFKNDLKNSELYNFFLFLCNINWFKKYKFTLI